MFNIPEDVAGDLFEVEIHVKGSADVLSAEVE